MHRLCTEELKSKPAIDYVLSHTEHLIIIEGIRKNESLARSRMSEQCTYFKYYFEPMINGKTHSYRKKDVIEWCKKHNADKIRPVFTWTAEMVIEFIKANDQLPNPLYYQGFKRVGCFPCIMSSHGEMRLIIENHPERLAELKSIEQNTGLGMSKPDYIPKRFCGNGQWPTIEDIEKYLTEKNSTADMFDEGGQPGCMSVYGLCE